MRDDVDPPLDAVREAVSCAIAEDTTPLGDITASLIPKDALGRAGFVARTSGVIAGTRCAVEVCAQLDEALQCVFTLNDGASVAAGDCFGTIEGPLRSLVTAERSALNFLSHLSGIATLTRRFVDEAATASSFTTIWDTRKTTPGLRALEKAAVRAGGGANHRGSLSEAVLIKDNYLGRLTITDAVALARQRWPGRMIEVECDRPEQVTEAVKANATIVLLDNMSPEEASRCVNLVRQESNGTGAILVEASGGIRLDNVAAYARVGVDLISVGALTHSAPILDIGLDLL